MNKTLFIIVIALLIMLAGLINKAPKINEQNQNELCGMLIEAWEEATALDLGCHILLIKDTK